MEDKKYEIVHLNGTGEPHIRALKDFETIDGNLVHKGDIGGYISETAKLSQEGKCWADENSYLSDTCTVSGDALVKGSHVRGMATVSDFAMIHNVKVVGNSYVGGHANLDGTRTCSWGRGEIEGLYIRGDSIVAGDVTIDRKKSSADADDIFIDYKYLFEKEISFEDRLDTFSSDVSYSNVCSTIYNIPTGKNAIQHDISNYKEEMIQINKKRALYDGYFRLPEIKQLFVKDVTCQLGYMFDNTNFDENKAFNEMLKEAIHNDYFPRHEQLYGFFREFVKQNQLNSVFTKLSDEECKVVKEINNWFNPMCDNFYCLDDFKRSNNPFKDFLSEAVEDGFIFYNKENREFVKKYIKENDIKPCGYFILPENRQKIIDEILDWKFSRNDRLADYYNPTKGSKFFIRCCSHLSTNLEYMYNECITNAARMNFMPKENATKAELLKAYGNFLLNRFTVHTISMDELSKLYTEKEKVYGLFLSKDNDKVNTSLKPNEKNKVSQNNNEMNL